MFKIKKSLSFLGLRFKLIIFSQRGLNELKASKNDWEFYCLGRHLGKKLGDGLNYPEKTMYLASQQVCFTKRLHGEIECSDPDLRSGMYFRHVNI